MSESIIGEPLGPLSGDGSSVTGRAARDESAQTMNLMDSAFERISHIDDVTITSIRKEGRRCATISNEAPGQSDSRVKRDPIVPEDEPAVVSGSERREIGGSHG